MSIGYTVIVYAYPYPDWPDPSDKTLKNFDSLIILVTQSTSTWTTANIIFESVPRLGFFFFRFNEASVIMYETILFALLLFTFLTLYSIYKYLTLIKTSTTIKGPVPLPIIGSLHLLGKYPTPFEGFTALSKIYGDIYSIYLGSARCVVVNNFALIKEVLIKKGLQFGGRPNYLRYHKLFGGDRNNCK